MRFQDRVVLISGAAQGIGAATKEIGRLALIKCELFADCGDVPRVYIGGIDLTLELTDALAVAIAVRTLQEHFTAGRAEVTRDARHQGSFALVDIGHVARVVDEFGLSTARALHGHSSLNETIRTSSITVSFR